MEVIAIPKPILELISVYTGRDSTVGNFAKASAPDFSSMTRPISIGDMGDAVDKKDGDDGAGENPTFESRPV